MNNTQEPQENRVDRPALLTFIYQLHSFMTSSHYPKWFNDQSCRFEPEGDTPMSELFAKFHRDMAYGMQAGPDDVLQLAEDLAQRWEIKIALKDRRFVVPRGEKPIVRIKDFFFDAAKQSDALSSLSNPSNPDHTWGVSTFDVERLCYEFWSLAMSKFVLTEDTGNPIYERLLSQYVPKVDYMTSGYPRDLLAHDYRDMKTGKWAEIEGLAFHDKYCATHRMNPSIMDFLQRERVYTFHYFRRLKLAA